METVEELLRDTQRLLAIARLWPKAGSVGQGLCDDLLARIEEAIGEDPLKGQP